ncbi:MAG: trypsin-like peptidase domain-containing protein [Bacillota bacterium]
MDYKDYYEHPDFYGEPRPPKKRSNFGAFVVTAILFMAIGALLMQMVSNNIGKQPPVPSPTSSAAETLPTATPAMQAPTPLPGERTLPEFDGKSPAVSDTFNPIPDIVEACTKGVVGVINYTSSSLKDYEVEQGGGSGFVISSEGYIITNAHVVEGATSIGVVLHDGTEVKARILGVDATADLAALKIDKTGLTALKAGDSDKTRVGEFTIAIGDPTGRQLSNTTTFGIISAVNRPVNIDGRTSNYIQTDAAINPGNSGGPLLNMNGEVIGITSVKTVSAGYDEFGNIISAEGLGFAIPISDAMPVIQQLITKGFVQRPGIGVSVVQPSALEIEEWGIPKGIIVYSVTKDGPAHKAGLQKYDVIVSCNGTPTVDRDEFVKMVQGMKVGDSMTIKYWRDEKYYECTVVVGDLNSMGSELVEQGTVEGFGW